MLQQTQASRVAPAFDGFLHTFPTIDALAAADPADVLRAWGSLGYNRRALHLYKAACAIVERGAFPTGVEELMQLPGVGAYTARAVASFAFGADCGVVEANVRRILSRVFGPMPSDGMQSLADSLLPSGSSPTWNQALMDLGADVCRARDPRCADCPLQQRCSWAAGNRPAVPRVDRPAFASTTRYARGRVVAHLRGVRRWTTIDALIQRTGLTAERVTKAVAALERDAIVTTLGRRVRLGPRQRGARSRSISATT